MAKKKHGLVDRLMHPGSNEEPDEVERQEQIEGGGSEEVEGDEASPAVKTPESKPRKAGKRDRAADYQTHPKFAKFKGRA